MRECNIGDRLLCGSHQAEMCWSKVHQCIKCIKFRNDRNRNDRSDSMIEAKMDNDDTRMFISSLSARMLYPGTMFNIGEDMVCRRGYRLERHVEEEGDSR